MSNVNESLPKKYDFVWVTSEDLTLSLEYLRGKSEDDVKPVDFTGQQARMDIRAPDRTLLVTLNSDDIADTDPETTGSTPDTQKEIDLDAFGNMLIQASRTYTLPGGTVYNWLSARQLDEVVLDYNILVRGTGGDQYPLVEGKILFKRGATLWT